MSTPLHLFPMCFFFSGGRKTWQKGTAVFSGQPGQERRMYCVAPSHLPSSAETSASFYIISGSEQILSETDSDHLI